MSAPAFFLYAIAVLFSPSAAGAPPVRDFQAVARSVQVSRGNEPLLRKVVQLLNTDKDIQSSFYGKTLVEYRLELNDGSGFQMIPSQQPGTDGRLAVLIQIGRKDLANPLMVADYLARLFAQVPAHQALTRQLEALRGFIPPVLFSKPISWVETAADAEAGSPTAKALLEIWRINSQLYAFESALDERDPAGLFKGVDRADLKKKEAGFRAQAKVELAAQYKFIRENTAAKERAYKEFKASRSKAGPKLAEMVSRGDRKGVAVFLESSLPWPLMEPSEKSMWKKWVHSIEHPSDKKVLVFRGFSGQRQPQDADGGIHSFAPALFNSEVPGDFAKPLELLERQSQRHREHDLDPAQLFKGREAEKVPDLPGGIATLLEGAKKDVLINLSFDPDVSWNFAQAGHLGGAPVEYSMGAFAVDPARLQMNLYSGFTQDVEDPDREILAPLFLFPDETIYYEYGKSKNLATVYKSFLNEVRQRAKKSGGTRFGDRQAADVGLEQFRRAVLPTDELLNPGTRTFMLDGKSYGPGDAITLGRAKFEVVGFAGSGMSGTDVFQVKDTDGKFYALKIVRSSLETGEKKAVRDHLAEESETLFPLLEKFKLPHTQVIKNGKDFLLREWARGQRGSDWAEEWQAADHSKEFPGYAELLQFYRTLAQKGIYWSDFVPANMNWNGKEWSVFDPGHRVERRLSPAEAWEKFLYHVNTEWGNPNTPSCKKTFQSALRALAKKTR